VVNTAFIHAVCNNMNCYICFSERKRSNLIVLVAHTDDPTGFNTQHCEFVFPGRLCYVHHLLLQIFHLISIHYTSCHSCECEMLWMFIAFQLSLI